MGSIRIQNENTEQIVKATSGILQLMTITGNGAAAVVTISDGTAATLANILTILEVPIDKSQSFNFGVNMDNDIRVTPGAVTDDIIITYS